MAAASLEIGLVCVERFCNDDGAVSGGVGIATGESAYLLRGLLIAEHRAAIGRLPVVGAGKCVGYRASQSGTGAWVVIAANGKGGYPASSRAGPTCQAGRLGTMAMGLKV